MPQKAITHASLSTMVGSNIVVRSNVDNSQKSGTIIGVSGSNVIVMQNRSLFWLPTSPVTPSYLFTTD